METNILRFHHVGIAVRDMEDTIRFFETFLNCTRASDTRRLRGKDWEVAVSLLRAPGGTLIEPLEPVRGYWKDQLDDRGTGLIREIAFRVENLTNLYEDLARRGIHLTNYQGSPIDRPRCVPELGGTKTAYFPQEVSSGIRIELIEPHGPFDEDTP